MILVPFPVFFWYALVVRCGWHLPGLLLTFHCILSCCCCGACSCYWAFGNEVVCSGELRTDPNSPQ